MAEGEPFHHDSGQQTEQAAPMSKQSLQDPYSAFRDDRQRRLALEDRNRRDLRITRWLVAGRIVVCTVIAVGAGLVPKLPAWLP
jgi:hypothetical protein